MAHGAEQGLRNSPFLQSWLSQRNENMSESWRISRLIQGEREPELSVLDKEQVEMSLFPTALTH